MCNLQEHSDRSYREEMAKRIKLPIPEGALLPAEERLQNVLKAIEDRIHYERAELETMEQHGWYESVKEQRSFLQGLDIAWSVAKTESMRREGDNR